jgi:hypothetical protein
LAAIEVATRELCGLVGMGVRRISRKVDAREATRLLSGKHMDGFTSKRLARAAAASHAVHMLCDRLFSAR